MANKRNEQLVLSMDVSFNHIGMVMAAVDDTPIGYKLLECGCAHPKELVFGKKKKNGGELGETEANLAQAKELYLAVREFIAGRSIAMLVAEMPTGGAKSADALRAMSIATGAVGVITGLMDSIPFALVSPIQTKKLLCGAIDASKKKVEGVVKAFFDGFEWPALAKDREHVCDAAGALFVAKKTHHYTQLLQTVKGGKRGGTL